MSIIINAFRFAFFVIIFICFSVPSYSQETIWEDKVIMEFIYNQDQVKESKDVYMILDHKEKTLIEQVNYSFDEQGNQVREVFVFNESNNQLIPTKRIFKDFTKGLKSEIEQIWSDSNWTNLKKVQKSKSETNSKLEETQIFRNSEWVNFKLKEIKIQNENRIISHSNWANDLGTWIETYKIESTKNEKQHSQLINDSWILIKKIENKNIVDGTEKITSILDSISNIILPNRRELITKGKDLKKCLVQYWSENESTWINRALKVYGYDQGKLKSLTHKSWDHELSAWIDVKRTIYKRTNGNLDSKIFQLNRGSNKELDPLLSDQTMEPIIWIYPNPFVLGSRISLSNLNSNKTYTIVLSNTQLNTVFKGEITGVNNWKIDDIKGINQGWVIATLLVNQQVQESHKILIFEH